MSTTIIAVERIAQRIFLIRGKKVMLDKDLADFYGVKPIRLREQVKRNLSRFPDDFMFQLTQPELEIMVSHFAIPSKKYFGGSLPYVFTEQGVAMLSTVLNSERAIQVNIAIMRAFVKMRQVLSSHKELADRLAKLEQRMDKKDKEVMALFEAIRQLMVPLPERRKKPIGFLVTRK